ncbi:undecaprenyldiphospho-muramoylpentapeptide beta-N-acetylglucosaminyltransferase [Pararhizobium mangrovi]|uniref:UDP-N-acetylglucosamine--N-acetylmuramyl-(pentapeptide) pyrophosphoryl-undecaprenol N-acetylglucosamine transferase n=1 Tax=Pararhizobium mangrovi TaxID=2590452 RepID=A0A506U7E9_9HYPH|nr:undecaprenyldiphospho-muramoylpentapeptide beta-N-acetylglucosaminyltransferase [Pararhizobium mangrovi]TPW29276.1 undecaprenyldiphospho-muramoylpentapeptide beta-N-acetylglucosaminyltransferase [Pararhizobium mangrovi]
MAKTLLIAAGGTGGHLFPAEALAHAMHARGWTVRLVTDSRAQRYADAFPAEAIDVVRSATIGSKNPVRVASALWTLFMGIREAGRLIRSVRPDAVIGFGGYPTVPPLIAAGNAGVPSLLHEQNAVMGRANRALANRVLAVAGGFLPESEGKYAAKTVQTGNPVRPAVLEAAKSPYRPSHEDEPFRLVVFGGSQGARFFSEVLPAALRLLPEAERARLRVTQQARPDDADAARAAYDELRVEAEVSPFFSDMATRIGAAHLVVSRSGASTVSEISVIGRPAILVPYPHALDHDQAANAAALKAKGGAEVIAESELDADRLARLVGDAMREPERLAKTAAAAKAAGNPNATTLLAGLVESIAAGTPVADFRAKREETNP